MTIKTKKYQLPTKTFVKFAMMNVLREQWWVFLIAIAIAALTFVYPDTIWFYIIAGLSLSLYLLFWLIQFFGLTQLDQAKFIFEKLSYEIDPKQILLKISSKQGMPIKWEQIKKARAGKNHYLLIMNKAQIIHLPFKVFNSPRDVKMMETLLKRKNLIK
ncbi:MAG: YcxB family protein [Cytophagales bacterium]|nr:YcxB family protein [Hyphobacterium sp. CCMP332]